MQLELKYRSEALIKQYIVGFSLSLHQWRILHQRAVLELHLVLKFEDVFAVLFIAYYFESFYKQKPYSGGI